MDEQLSEDEVRSLSEKVAAFAASLPERERDAFAAVLSGGTEAPEVEGFAAPSPLRMDIFGSPFPVGQAKVVFPTLGVGAGKPKNGGTIWTEG